MTAPDSKRSRIQVLHIGGAGGLKWTAAASTEWLAAYDIIYCEPEPNTEAQQLALIARLRDVLAVDRRWRGRIVWVANPHLTSKVSNEIGCGTIVALPQLPEGRIISTLGSTTTAPVVALRDLPRKWIPLALWRNRQGTSELIIGAMSGDGRWIVAPPGATPEQFSLPNERLQRRLAVGFILLLLATLLFAGRREYFDTQRAYARDVGRIGDADSEHFTRPAVKSGTTGASASERMLNRLVWQRPKDLTIVSKELRYNLTPLQLWNASNIEERSRGYFSLALISGDVTSAYAIAAQSAHDEFIDWPQELTDTVWQRAVESLYELDFQRSAVYTELYVRLTDLHALGAAKRQELAPQRNRTLAKILQRELHSPRIQSLCRSPEAARAFARLLGGDWGEGLPGKLEGLEQLRAENAKKNCAGPVELVDYSQLARLETIDASTDVAAIPICKIVPRECEFLQLRDALFHYSDELRLYGTGPPSAIPAALQFAGTCSYLSDDTLAILFDMTNDQTVAAGLRLPSAALDGALACVDEKSDYAGMLRASAQTIPCGALSVTNKDFLSPLGSEAFARCRS